MKKVGVKITRQNNFESDSDTTITEPDENAFLFSSTIKKFSSTTETFDYVN